MKLESLDDFNKILLKIAIVCTICIILSIFYIPWWATILFLSVGYLFYTAYKKDK